MADPSYKFVYPIDFRPNPADPNNPAQRWQAIGDVVDYSQQENTFFLKVKPQASDNLRTGPVIYFLSKTAFRVRFSPDLNFDYSQEHSYAVVNRDLRGKNDPPLTLQVENINDTLVINTGTLTVKIKKKPYAIAVYRGNQLIHQDNPGYNLVYVSRDDQRQKAIANLKVYPDNAKYCGLGEKAGINLLKNEFTLTYFNFDNFVYSSAPVTPGTAGGPLNASEPLYASIPLLIENNPNPQGEYAGPAYSYGIFFDNPSQSFINIGTNDYSDMRGKYYFGALYGEIDYYFMAGDHAAQVLEQYTALTGRSPMPPKYVFGFHQGGYGYYSRYLLSVVANSYRAAQIPIDGLHIDVDFQNNYRTFTNSGLKFPNGKELLNTLRNIGFKCSTNITPLLTSNTRDENSELTSYEELNNIQLISGGLLYNFRVGDPPQLSYDLFIGNVSYGSNTGINPYRTPGGLQPPKLGAFGYYPNFELEEVRQVWGQQYQYLVNELGLDMIWQDMTDPAIVDSINNPSANTFPLDLLQYNGREYVPHAFIHNGYAINLLKATSEGLGKLRSQKRNFIIARGGYAGLQRYAALWTGDSASSWEFLQINIPEVLNLGLSGVPLSGCDIGGFANGNGSSPQGTVQNGKMTGGVTDAQLFTRWMHLGAFLPWYRNHYNAYTKQFQEVYAYGEPVISNCRKYVELRYRLLQVFYDAMYEWTQNGKPITRALFINEPKDQGVYGFSDTNGEFGPRRFVDDQFFVGKDLLVAPIVAPFNQPNGFTKRNVYLPIGSQWFAFKDNQEELDASVNGGQVIEYYADLALVPIYVRAGAILPTRELEQYVGQLPENPLTLNIYPGANSEYLLYQDDGTTTNAATQQAYRTTRISHSTTSAGKQITVVHENDKYQPPEQFYYIALLNVRVNTVQINSNNIPYLNTQNSGITPEQLAAQLKASPVHASYWNQTLNITFIKVFDTEPNVTIIAS